MTENILIFSHENLLRQLQTAQYIRGYYLLDFYVDDKGKPADCVTEMVQRFYLSPSGGTLRDSQMNLVMYDSRYDTYRGFRLPERDRGPRKT